MSLITQGKTNWKYIAIFVTLAMIAGGTIFWQVFLQKENDFLVAEPIKIENIHEKPIPSDEPLSVPEQPFLKIISPDGGEKWKVGDNYEIIFESFGVTKVSLSFWVPGDAPGSYGIDLAYEIDPNDSLQVKTYSWEVSTSVLDSYIDYGQIREWQVCLTAQQWPPVDDMSDETITIYRETFEEYQEALAKKEEEERQARNQKLTQVCLESSGQATVIDFCLSDFFSTCLVSPEGYFCLPEKIKKTQVCDCGPDSCFVPLSGCVNLKDKERILINQKAADLKGEGILQLAGFYELAGGVDGLGMGVVRVFGDETENIMVWESDSFPLESRGYLSVENNPAIGKNVIRLDWVVGAHGMVAKFFYWDGESFKEMGEFFSDGGGIGLDQKTGEILVGTRNYDCPLSETIWSIYEWNGDKYELTKIIESECP